jgi:N-acetyl-anhydromuramyl-L-alanine amidase AmpD
MKTRCVALAVALAAAFCAQRVQGDERDKVEKPKCEFVESPNFNEDTRGKGKINYVIIHTTEGTKKSAVNWFLNKASKVSAHYVIGHDGTITQMVRDKDRAWHAGVKLYNEEAIGIEHEGFAAKNTWTEAQVRVSAQLTRWLCHTYGIPVDRKHLLGHMEIAPGRKSDPGPYFDWDLYLKLIKDPKTKVDGAKKGEDKPAAPKQAEPEKQPEPEKPAAEPEKPAAPAPEPEKPAKSPE